MQGVVKQNSPQRKLIFRLMTILTSLTLHIRTGKVRVAPLVVWVVNEMAMFVL